MNKYFLVTAVFMMVPILVLLGGMLPSIDANYIMFAISLVMFFCVYSITWLSLTIWTIRNMDKDEN